MNKHFTHSESIQGIVERVTFHNETNGWSVLRVKRYNDLEPSTVIVHQTKVFAGATMKFVGNWNNHPKFGRQFTASQAEEQKPATSAALEKYLGSGLIKGVGPKTAKRIVNYFGKNTLNVFDESIDDLLNVPGIAHKKLKTIRNAWEEHKSIRDIMIFLQGLGISTLFAVRIFKEYGQNSIPFITENPYRLATDFYGIGFFSADKVALSLGIEENDPIRITAAIRHILAASREQGHCYLLNDQILDGINELLELDVSDSLTRQLTIMERENLLKKRIIPDQENVNQICYYSKSLYYAEKSTSELLHSLNRKLPVDSKRISQWIDDYFCKQSFRLSPEQENAVKGIAGCGCSILTGGPGCGKTTATKTLVKLFVAMGKEVLLAAPTGRAAQRMEEVIGLEAKTIHRLLEFQNGGFKRNKENPLECDVLIVDECSMLDISLSASLLSAIPENAQFVLVGDADQLPSVGAGNVLGDLIASNIVPTFALKTVFRQAKESHIVSYAHGINKGKIPHIPSPFKLPQLWQDKCDCLFIDSNEATQEQLRTIRRVKEHIQLESLEEGMNEEQLYGTMKEENNELQKNSNRLMDDARYDHINFGLLQTAENRADELRAVLKKTHPWSSLYYGLTAGQVILRLYSEWIPKYFGDDAEIQILSPMTRGSLGTAKLNHSLQESVNPGAKTKGEISLGERIYRVGDRVIHRRNNYDLGVYNGDIGTIVQMNSIDLTCTVQFFSDNRKVEYQRDQLSELDLAYAITIHKSQGSEFDCVIIPLVSQHFKMLFRNLIYTGLTRAKKLAVFVGTRQALAMAIHNKDTAKRQTALSMLLQKLQHNSI
ncbi:MAG TPA: recombinase RecD [Desulfocapsa sulfexigens]|nr:recombinase RecD [Desulfocapsa sulfexigens]